MLFVFKKDFQALIFDLRKKKNLKLEGKHLGVTIFVANPPFFFKFFQK